MWKAFDIEELKAKVAGSEPAFHEFLRSAQMSCAVYRLPAGSRDMQAPHLEDELYLVLEGHARVHVDNQEQNVGPGSLLFIKATTEHTFFNITADLTLLAVFGPSAK